MHGLGEAVANAFIALGILAFVVGAAIGSLLVWIF